MCGFGSPPPLHKMVLPQRTAARFRLPHNDQCIAWMPCISWNFRQLLGVEEPPLQPEGQVWQMTISAAGSMALGCIYSLYNSPPKHVHNVSRRPQLNYTKPQPPPRILPLASPSPPRPPQGSLLPRGPMVANWSVWKERVGAHAGTLPGDPGFGHS